MLKNLLQRVVPSLAQFRDNSLKKKYKKKRIYSQFNKKRQQRFFNFLKN